MYLFFYLDLDGIKRKHQVNAYSLESAERYATNFCDRYGFTLASLVAV